MNKAMKVTAGLVLALAAWGAPAAATAVGVNSPDGGARAAEINNWRDVRVCDQVRDGWGVYSRYHTPAVSNRIVSEYGGQGQCNETPGSPNVVAFNACTDKTTYDSCSGLVHKP